MILRLLTIRTTYLAPDGTRIDIDEFPGGTANVTATGADGKHIFGGAYATRRGAMVAVGKRFGKAIKFVAQRAIEWGAV
jgi:hypothetical protein